MLRFEYFLVIFFWNCIVFWSNHLKVALNQVETGTLLQTRNKKHNLRIAVTHYTCLHSQFKIVRYRCSVELPFKKGVNLVIIRDFPHFVLWSKTFGL